MTHTFFDIGINIILGTFLLTVIALVIRNHMRAQKLLEVVDTVTTYYWDGGVKRKNESIDERIEELYQHYQRQMADIRRDYEERIRNTQTLHNRELADLRREQTEHTTQNDEYFFEVDNA